MALIAFLCGAVSRKLKNAPGLPRPEGRLGAGRRQPRSGGAFFLTCRDLRFGSEILNREDRMAVVGPVHQHGTLTGVRADAATRLPNPVSVYLCFRTADDQQANVEISFDEAAYLHGWLADIVNPAQGR